MKTIARIGMSAATLLLSHAALAQDAGVALNRFDPSERGSDWFTGESLDLRGSLRPAAGLVTDWSHDPLVVRNSDGSTRTALIDDAVYVHAGASLTLWDRLRVGISAPLDLYQGGQTGTLDGTTYSPSSGTSFGDVRIGADVRLFGVYGSPITMALGVQGYIPSGSKDALSSDGSFRAAPRVMAAGRIGPFVYSGRLAVMFQSNQSFGGSQIGDELVLNATAGLQLLHDRLIVGPELYGSTVVGDNASPFSAAETPLEGLAGAHYHVTDEWRVGAGIGAGLARGDGSPLTRVVASLEWAPGANPPRGAPAHEVEPAAPLPIPPLVPPSDRDGDGFSDAQDACPDIKGVDSPDPSRRGCPAPVAVELPKPPSDRDADGIADASDACPDAAGPSSTDPKKNGCPKAVLIDHQIRILEQIKFRFGSAELDPQSDEILQAVLGVLNGHPEVTRLSVQGHTDDRGPNTLNDGLSRSRAASVRAWLVSHGVDPARIDSQGFGSSRPIVANTTEDGRRQNRRVEFVVVGERGRAEASR